MECVLAVVEHGNFTRAAAALHRTQPSLSYAIGRLEAELATALFSRRGRVSVLTPAGEAFVVEARRSIAAAERARQAAASVGGLLMGHIDIAVIGPLVTPAARVVSMFRTEHPGVTVGFRTGEPHEMVGWVRSSIAAIAFGRVDRLPPDVVGHRLGDEETVATFPPGTEVPQCTDFTALASFPIVGPSLDTPFRSRFEAMVTEFGFEVVAEAHDMHSMLELVLSGVGAAIVSRSGSVGFVARGGVVSRLPASDRYQAGLMHRHGRLTPTQAALRSLATEQWEVVSADP